jgi:threonine dehydrogenase-like Zn-dependent dehydrogenase
VRVSREGRTHQSHGTGLWYVALDNHGEMVQLVRSGFPLSRIITHRFPLEKAQEAFDVFMSRNAGKVIFEY